MHYWQRNLAQQLLAVKAQQLQAAKPQQLHCGQRNHSNCNAHTVTADMEFLPGALHLTHAREDMPGAMQHDTVGLNTVRLKNVMLLQHNVITMAARDQMEVDLLA